MSGIFQHRTGIFFEHVKITLSGRTIDHTRLTETASTDTATLDLQNHAVLRTFDKWNDWFLRIRCCCHIHHDLFFNGWRYIITDRRKTFNRTIFMIRNFIEFRYIDSRNLCCLMQKVRTAPVFLFCFFIKVKKSVIDHLPFSDIEHIKEICQGLWIVDTWTAADHDRIIPGTLLRLKRNTGKIQNL